VEQVQESPHVRGIFGETMTGLRLFFPFLPRLFLLMVSSKVIIPIVVQATTILGWLSYVKSGSKTATSLI